MDLSTAKPIYLDYAATTPVDPRVAAHMAGFLTADGVFGNPASRSHAYGWAAEEAVEIAREDYLERLAVALVGAVACSPDALAPAAPTTALAESRDGDRDRTPNTISLEKIGGFEICQPSAPPWSASSGFMAKRVAGSLLHQPQ